MSNYPPGVTGFEPQIAGYDEYDSTRSVRVEEYCESAPEGYVDVPGVIYVIDRYSAEFVWECDFCKGEHTIPINEFED